MEIVRTEILANGIGHGIRGQRTGSNDHRAFRHLGHFLGNHLDIGMTLDLIRNHLGKTVTVNRQAAAGFHTGGIGTGDDQTTQSAQFFFQKTNGIFQPVTAQRIGADQFRKGVAMVRRGLFVGLHFVKLHLDATLGKLPCSFCTGKTGTDHFYRCHDLLPPVFLAADFFAAGFLAAVFLAAVFLVAVFLAVAFFSVFFSPSASVSTFL